MESRVLGEAEFFYERESRDLFVGAEAETRKALLFFRSQPSELIPLKDLERRESFVLGGELPVYVVLSSPQGGCMGVFAPMSSPREGASPVFFEKTRELLSQLRMVRLRERVAALHVAARLSHDFNNYIGAASGAAGLLERSFTEGEKGMRRAQLIGESLDRCAELSNQLSALSEKSERLQESFSAQEVESFFCEEWCTQLVPVALSSCSDRVGVVRGNETLFRAVASITLRLICSSADGAQFEVHRYRQESEEPGGGAWLGGGLTRSPSGEHLLIKCSGDSRAAHGESETLSLPLARSYFCESVWGVSRRGVSDYSGGDVVWERRILPLLVAELGGAVSHQESSSSVELGVYLPLALL
ncbi:hypothetical protein MRY87_12925 [bacterium]|nr:hypothetical protein [bacterium]